jgi:hypothetical protein
MRTLTIAFIGLSLLLPGCKKKVDAAYLKQIQDATAAICACTSVAKAQQVTCMGKAGSPHPKAGPNGEPPGIYEEKLDDASKVEIEAERSKYSSCEAKIMQ